MDNNITTYPLSYCLSCNLLQNKNTICTQCANNTIYLYYCLECHKFISIDNHKNILYGPKLCLYSDRHDIY